MGSDIATDDRSIEELRRRHSQTPRRLPPRYTVNLLDIAGPSNDPATAPQSPSAARLPALRRIPASNVLGLSGSYSDGELRAISATEGPDEHHLDAGPAQSSATYSSVHTSTRHLAIADVADAIMAPLNDLYNAAENTYTIQLDWVIDIIGASECHCTEASRARNVLGDDSQYRQLVHLRWRDVRMAVWQTVDGRHAVPGGLVPTIYSYM